MIEIIFVAHIHAGIEFQRRLRRAVPGCPRIAATIGQSGLPGRHTGAPLFKWVYPKAALDIENILAVPALRRRIGHPTFADRCEDFVRAELVGVCKGTLGHPKGLFFDAQDLAESARRRRFCSRSRHGTEQYRA